MSRTIYFTATSLDGFIATGDHSLDWLFATDPGDSMADIDSFVEGIGAAVMGASTYEWILRYEGDKPWPYAFPVWVLTHRELPCVDGDIRFASADTDEEMRALHRGLAEAADGRDVWAFGGGAIVASLARLGLLDEVDVSIAPVTLGAGAPLLDGRVNLRPLDISRAGDLVRARYEVVRS